MVSSFFRFIGKRGGFILFSLLVTLWLGAADFDHIKPPLNRQIGSTVQPFNER